MNNIKPSKKLPFVDHGDFKYNFFETIKNSSRRRGYSYFYFIFRKIKNIILYRMAYFCPLNSWRVRMHKWRGITIGKLSIIDKQCNLDNAYPEYIYIGDHVGVNQGCTIITHSMVKSHFRGVVTPELKPVIIKDNALIGINSTILPGVTIGKYAIVSAGAVVSKDVPDYCLVQGNPVKKSISFEHIIKENQNNEEGHPDNK